MKNIKVSKEFNKEIENSGKEITSLSQYLEYISEITKKVKEEGKIVAYRGQSKEYWDIRPSIFRDGMLNDEYYLMNEPIIKCPSDFNIDNKLDILVKLQHYGMCTRLLDLTENPLVALYFACKEHEEERYRIKDRIQYIKPYGCIYYLFGYSEPPFSENVIIKSILSMAEFKGGREKLKDVIELIEKEDVINKKSINEWKKGRGYNEFVDIIQRNCIVKARITNDRLERQKGLFLFAGCYNFYKQDNLLDSEIHRATCDLRSIFEKEFIYVKGKNKHKILEELDMCGINEFALFPELEHKLSYVKNRSLYKGKGIEDFIEYSN